MRGRWLLVGLVASLVVNLFLIGAAVGVLALGARTGALQPLRNASAMRRAAMSLAPPHRRAMVAVLRADAQTLRASVIQSRDLRRQAWSGLDGENPDVAGAKARLRQARALDQSDRGVVEESIVDFAATLPPPERAALSRALAAAVPVNPR